MLAVKSTPSTGSGATKGAVKFSSLPFVGALSLSLLSHLIISRTGTQSVPGTDRGVTQGSQRDTVRPWDRQGVTQGSQRDTVRPWDR